jgi:hypothetical protein
MRTVAAAFLAGFLGLQIVAASSGLQHGRKEMPSAAAQTPAHSPTTIVGNSPDAEIPDPMQDARRARYNSERQAQAMTDARRLAQLSRELQDELEHAGGDTLPASLFKKADEIIKLAKSVKGKMRSSF